MDLNLLPAYDLGDKPTGCCPRFNPEGWDEQDLHFENKLFVRAVTTSVLHVPINMGSVFAKTHAAIEEAKAKHDHQFVVLSRELSPWAAEHLFAVTKDVPGQEMVHLSGDFRTRVFEGSYGNVAKWHREMEADLKSKGLEPHQMYFFYTVCPKCAQAYGKNYVVAVAAYEPHKV